MTSDLTLFFKRVFCVGFITVTCMAIVFFGIRPDPTGYLTGSLQQVNLLRKTSGPRIILIGGSNVAFGLDAELMQKELDLPVINDGLHAGLGILPLRELQQYLHVGDTVIISLEYKMFSSREAMNGDPTVVSDWIEADFSRAQYLFNPVAEIPEIYSIMFQRKVNRSLEQALNSGSLDEIRNMFNSKNFDANGDFIGHLHIPSVLRKKIPYDPFPVEPLQDDVFRFLKSFKQAVEIQGVHVYWEAPASRQVNCDATGEVTLANFFEILQQRTSIPLLTSVDQVCIPDKYFFDSPYHLDAKGRELRTQRLIANLEQAWVDSK